MDVFVILLLIFGFILSTTPVPAALGLTSFFCFIIFADSAVLTIGKGSFEYLNNFSFTAVLFFIVMGAIMTAGSSARRLIGFVNSLVGFMSGGMAISVVGVCMLFGAISGSSIATLVAIGTMMVPAMVERGYGKDFSVGLLTSSAELGILVPPSIPMIILALVLNISVGRIFLAGYFPALLFAFTYWIYCFVFAKRNLIKRENFPTAIEIWDGFLKSFGAMVLIIIIAGGIYGGVFTASEAAAIGTVYAIVLEVCFYRSLSIKSLINTIKNASITFGPLMFIVVGATFMGEFITIQMLPQKITNMIVSNIDSAVSFLLIMNIMLLVTGMFIDMLSSIIIMSPILMPIACQFGIDPVHFGIIYVFNMGIGYITPPVGLDLYVSMGLFDLPLGRVVKACLPFFLILAVDLLLITFLPSISLFLPNLIMGPR